MPPGQPVMCPAAVHDCSLPSRLDTIAFISSSMLFELCFHAVANERCRNRSNSPQGAPSQNDRFVRFLLRPSPLSLSPPLNPCIDFTAPYTPRVGPSPSIRTRPSCHSPLHFDTNHIQRPLWPGRPAAPRPTSVGPPPCCPTGPRPYRGWPGRPPSHTQSYPVRGRGGWGHGRCF